MTTPSTIIFQSAKLGDIPHILAEFEWAERLQRDGVNAGRVYGVSGGALVALAFGLALAARRNPARWEKAQTVPADFASFLRRARSRDIRTLNLNPLYGFYNLRMRALTDLLYEHYRLRARYTALLDHVPSEVAAAHSLPADFRREWEVGMK